MVSHLAAYAEGRQGPTDLPIMELVVSSLSSRAEWTVSAPEIVDVGDGDDRTVGVLLQLPGADLSDPETEWRALADVEVFVEALEQATKTYPRDLAVQLDGEIVGFI